MDELKIGAAYIRVSTDMQVEYSPDSQLKLILDYAKREGYIIPDEYIFREPDGISGKSAERRPAFKMMIAQAKEQTPPFSAIFVWKYSRFARNQEEAILYKNLLRKNGVSVISISEPSSDSPFASLIERIIEWMDEYYLINLSSEVRRGMIEKAQRGEAMGNPPFGYAVKDKRLVPDEHADTVRWIFDQYNSGRPMKQIALELSGMGIKTRRGSVPDSRFVKYILRNPVYVGKIRYSTEGHADYLYSSQNDNAFLVDGLHEAIISQDDFDRANARVAKNAEAKYVRNKSNVVMLKGLLRCSSCGATLVYSPHTHGFQCHNYSTGKCGVSHYISLKKANAAAITALEEVIGSKTFRFTPRRKSKRVTQDWDKLIAAEETKLNRARNAFLDGVFTPQEYAAVKSGVEDTIAKLKEAKEKESAHETVDTRDYSERVVNVIDLIKSSEISEERKNAALRAIIDRIVYNRADNVMEFTFKI